MAETFIVKIAKTYGKPTKHISEEAKGILLRHDWPGNVRELKNLMERAMILSRGGEITIKDLGHLDARQAADSDSMSFPEFSNLREAREWFENIYIQRELKLQDGNVARVAERLGLDRSNLYKRLRSLNSICKTGGASAIEQKEPL
jgi:DNA-binding NtrC family response regulator